MGHLQIICKYHVVRLKSKKKRMQAAKIKFFRFFCNEIQIIFTVFVRFDSFTEPYPH